MIKPPRLQAGDTVAVLSTSWGGPHVFPHVFDAGVDALTSRFGLRVREGRTTRWAPDALRNDPRARAADLNEAFADPSVAAIFCSIGGEDSARILPFLDADAVVAHPKILMGYSDSATQLTWANQLGLVTFNGPSVMAGFAQLRNFPAASEHVRALLFDPTDTYQYRPYREWVDTYEEWRVEDNATRVGPRRAHDGWHWLQTSGTRSGALFGGCIEVLEFLKGSRWWPAEEFWDGRILFLEMSEERPTVEQVRAWLFNYGVQGVFDRLSGLIFGRARGYTDDEKRALDEMILDVIAGQFRARHLNVVTNMDFGHTDPQWILPLGIRAELNPSAGTFQLLEPAVR